MTDRLWYVLITDPQAERRVQERTKHLGHEVYIPISKTFPARRQGRLAPSPVIERPLFRGYAFCRLPTLNTPWSSYVDDERTISPVGGQRFISNAGRPAPLAPGVIEDLKHREAAGEFDETALSDDGRYVIPNWIKLGKTVRVIAGPFAGFIGSISKIINARMVSVWLTIFGRASLVDMPLGFIEKSR